MSEMVERVAKAILHHDVDEAFTADDCRALARAAIKAMREHIKTAITERAKPVLDADGSRSSQIHLETALGIVVAALEEPE